MFISKMSLPRRTFLRGVGATLALPLLDAMVPALSALSTTAAAPVPRLGFVYVPNGAVMGKWKPTGTGREFEFSPMLSPLTPFRDRVLVLSGLAQMEARSYDDGAGDHSRGTAAWLSGIHAKRTEGADVRLGITVDQIAAKEFGAATPLASLELALETIDLVGNCDNGYSCAYMNTLSWRSPTTPLPVEINPRKVFRRLFGQGNDAAQRLAQMHEDRSLLDSVRQDVARLQTTLGPRDNSRLTEYLDAIRDAERRIQKAEQRSSKEDLPVLDAPAGVPDTFEEHIKLMFDLQALAYQADLTRVITFMVGRELSNRTYPAIEINEAHHSLSHHQNNAEKLAKLAKINAYHITKLAYFLEQLRNVPDGDGSLLDHLTLVYGSGLSDGNRHDHSPLPTLLIGGGAGRLTGGRHLEYPKDTPMTNLLVTVMDKAGVRIDKLGDSTGALDLETLSGV
jgi:hypothetical protein